MIKRENHIRSNNNLANIILQQTSRISVHAMFVLLSILALYPIFWLAINALKTEVEMFENTWKMPTVWHWEHYARAWEFGLSGYIINSGIVTVSSVVITVVISSMAAYALSRLKFKGQTFFLFFILGGLMLAPEVTLIPLFRILVFLKIYNTYFALILPYVAFGIPFSTFLIRSYMLGIPKDLEDAAYVDGAGPFHVFIHVILPLSRPIIASAMLLQAMRVWNEFMFALTFIESEKFKTLTIGITSFQSALRTEWSVLMAGLVISSIPMIILFLIAQRNFIRGLTLGGLKG